MRLFSTLTHSKNRRGALKSSQDAVVKLYIAPICISCYTTLVDVPTRGCLKKCVIIEYRPFGPIIIVLL